MRGSLGFGAARLLFLAQPGDAFFQTADNLSERLDLFLLAEHGGIQRAEVPLQMCHEQFQRYQPCFRRFGHFEFNEADDFPVRWQYNSRHCIPLHAHPSIQV